MKKKNQNNKNYILPVMLLFADLVLLYYLKYTINNLSLREFGFNSAGNIFNFLLTFLISIGIIAGSYSKMKKGNNPYYVILFLITLTIIPHVGIIILNSFHFAFPDKLIFNYPLRKAYIAFLFIFSAFVQIYLLVFVWGSMFEKSGILFLKSLIVTVSFYAVVILLAFAFSAGGKKNPGSQNNKYDSAVVLGAAVWSHNKPSPLFESRIKKALELYNNGNTKYIQLTGGNAPGELSEAETAANYLLKRGVNKKDILVEEHTSTTSEQVRYIKENLLIRKDVKKIVIISDQFHIKRVLEICKFFKVKADGITSDYRLNWEKLLYYRLRESVALLLFWFFAI